MFGESLSVSAYVTVDQGCPVAISVQDPERVEIVCGWAPRHSFEWAMHREALRALVQLGADALEQMDAAAAEDESLSDAAAC